MVQEPLPPQIIPAILPDSIEELRDKLAVVSDLVPMVQIDVCDGKLTPYATWPYNEKKADDFESILGGEEGLPFWDVVDFEIDLMVMKPENEVEKWIAAGAYKIVVHYESTDEETLMQILFDLKNREIVTSLAILVDTPIDVIDPFVHLLDEVQVMGIAHEGMQGEPFDDLALEHVQAIRRKYPYMNIAVDGGVNLETVPAILQAGANHLVIGSALFHNFDVEENLRSFEELIYDEK